MLRDVYYDPNSPACYAGVDAVYREAKRRLSSVTKLDVIKYLSEQEVYTLHKPLRRKFPRNKVVATGLDSDWQADLCDVQGLRKENDGHGYILTVIDVLSKYAWALPLRTKKPDEVRDAFKRVLATGRTPWRLMTDKGNEFVGRPFKDFVDSEGIEFFTAKNPDVKCPNVENFNRRLKTRLWKLFTKTRNRRWIDALPKIVSAINHSYSRVIKRRPVDVTFDNQNEVWKVAYGHLTSTHRLFKFELGDKIRISKYKHLLEKGYLPTFTTEIFVVTHRIARNPPVYRIKDLNDEPIEGVFYENEMVKVIKTDDIYRIERVIATRTRHGVKEQLVKWDGYPDSFNQWIKASDMVSL